MNDTPDTEAEHFGPWNIQQIAMVCYLSEPSDSWQITSETETTLIIECDTCRLTMERKP